MSGSVPPDRECRSAYEYVRGAFSALHRACVTEARRLMVEACEATRMEVRTGVIGKALGEASAMPGSGGTGRTGTRASLAAETLRTAHWIDPMAFLRTMRGKPSGVVAPGLCKPTAEWIAYAQAVGNARTRGRPFSEPRHGTVSASDFAATLHWCVPDDASKRTRPIASVIMSLRQEVPPDVVTHIVAECVTRLASYDEAIAYLRRECRA